MLVAVAETTNAPDSGVSTSYWNGQRSAGLALGCMGVAGIIGGAVAGSVALSKNKASKLDCSPTTPNFCSDAGASLRSGAITAGNFACAAGGTCHATCVSDEDCVTNYSCSAGACLLANGQTCAMAGQCASNFCVDGVCCNNACNESCHACSAALTGGDAGTCANAVDNSLDPRNVCVVSPPTSCGSNGKCVKGACEDWASGTVCGTVHCFIPADGGAQYVTLSQCDGMGNCAPSTATETCPTSPMNVGCATVDTACGCIKNANCPPATPTCSLPAGVCVPL